MRALVLLLVLAGTLYVAWSRFGLFGGSGQEPAPGSAEVEAAPPATAPVGRLLSLEDLEAPVEETPATAATQAPAASGALAAEAAEPQQGGGGDLPLDWSFGDLAEQGALLAHGPETLPDYLRGPGRDLSEARKHLLFAYALCIRGLLDEARRYAEGLESSPEVTPTERDLLRAALAGRLPQTRVASTGTTSPLVLGARMGLAARKAATELAARRCKPAAELLSEVLLAELDAPWASDRASLARWSEQLEDAQSCHRWKRDGDWPAVEMTVQDGDSLVAMRKRYLDAHPDGLLCTGIVERANQLGQYIRAGMELRIPTDRAWALVDLSAHWVFYLHGDEVVAAWECAIGREGRTIPGEYTAGEKVPEPPWFQPGRDPIPYGHPDNPLGTRWIGWDNSPGLGFHGTWEPETVGTDASDGCIRLHNEDVEELFRILPKGARISVRP